MIRGIHHTSYTVSDIDRSIAFYTGGLGFELLSDRSCPQAFSAAVTSIEGVALRVAHLKGYGQGLELIQYSLLAAKLEPAAISTAVRTCDAGSSHLCFVVDDIHAEMKRLVALGARPVSAPQEVDGGPNRGNLCVYFLDPDGIPMELSQPRHREEPSEA